MPFDMGFNYRSSAGYVTDGPEGVPVLGETYPHTYTNGNGDSINAGWSGSLPATYDHASGNDPRLAGSNVIYAFAGGQKTFTVDLSSGSAPGAGNYIVDLALWGATWETVDDHVWLYDDTTLLLDASNGGSGYKLASNHWVDATLADVTATTSWTGTTAPFTYATTTAKLVAGGEGIGFYTQVAHFRLTLGAAQSVVPVLMAQYRQRRG